MSQATIQADFTLGTEGVPRVADAPGIWSVASINGREHEAVAIALAEIAPGLTVYSPKIKEMRPVHTRGGGIRTFICDRQAFPNYLFFAWIDPMHRGEALSVRGVHNLLRVTDQPRFRRELAQIERAIEFDPFLSTGDWRVPGAMARIRTGPLMGIEGKIVASSGGGLMLVGLDMRGAVELNVQAWEIEPI